jgi:hypothetical protein
MAITLEEIQGWTQEASAEHLRRNPGRTIDPYRVMHVDEWLEANDGEELWHGPDGVVAVVMVPCDPASEDIDARRWSPRPNKDVRAIVIEHDDPEPAEYRDTILASATVESA